MWRDQVRELDKLVPERGGDVLVLFLPLCIVVPLHLDAFRARTPWTTSSALGGYRGFLARDSSTVVHGDGRDRAPLGVRDVEQVADRLVLLLELRSHVLGRRNPTTRGQKHLEGRFLPDRRQRYKVVGVALPELFVTW